MVLAIHDSVPGEPCIVEEVGEPVGGGPEAQPLGIIVLGETAVDFLCKAIGNVTISLNSAIRVSRDKYKYQP